MSDQKLSRLDTLIIGCLLGGIPGLIGGAVIAGRPTEAKVFQRENNKPNVMRIYSSGVEDSILVQDKETRKYISVGKYLSKMEDTSTKNLERAEIEKAVDWYK